jgi:hypothetical protein
MERRDKMMGKGPSLIYSIILTDAGNLGIARRNVLKLVDDVEK